MKKLLLGLSLLISMNSHAIIVNEGEYLIEGCGKIAFGITDDQNWGVNFTYTCMVSATTTSLPTVLYDDSVFDDDLLTEDELVEFEQNQTDRIEEIREAYEELQELGIPATRNNMIDMLR